VLKVSLHQTPCIIERQRRSRPDALSFERFVPALDLPVRLRVKRRGSDVRHARDPNELLEVLSDELRPIARDDPGSRVRRSICKILVTENACLKSVSPLSDDIVHSRNHRQTSALLVADELQKKRRSRQWSPW
jgi:hypothetical protein